MSIELKIPKDVQFRPHYLEQVRPFMGKNIIKVFTGQRRVGKSYLLYQLMEMIRQENKDASILYINKEDLDFSFLKNAEDLNDYVLEHKSTTGFIGLGIKSGPLHVWDLIARHSGRLGPPAVWWVRTLL